MAISSYIDPTLGAVGGVTNIVGGTQNQDPAQVVQGVGDTLGAYTIANSVVMSQAYETAIIYATEELGLAGNAAVSYAQQAADGAQLTGASTVGKWLPWIGAGLAIYDWATGEITADSTMNLAGTLTVLALPWMGVVVGPAMVSRYFLDKSREKANVYVKMVEPSLELVHKDENGNYYLRGINSRDNTLNPCDPSKNGNCQETYLKYNANTNELDTVILDRPPNPNAETGHWKEEPVNGAILENASWENFDPYIWKKEIKSVKDLSPYGTTVAWMVNVPSLQAQIYNQVLLPEGLAPLPSTTPINLNGKEYYKDSSDVIYRANGQIVGKYDSENNSIASFIVKQENDLGCKMDKKTGEVEINHDYYGEISNTPAYIPSDSFVTIGMGPQATNANHAAWLNGTQPNGDFITPYIGEEGITYEQYVMLEQNGSVKLGANHNPDNVIKWDNNESGYILDTSTGNLLYNGVVIGRTQITEDKYIYTAGNWGQRVPDGEGEKVYAAAPYVWDLDGNMLGRIEISYDGHIALEVNPGLSNYYEGNEARKNDPNIDPNSFNQYYTIHGDEDPNMFGWNTIPNYTMGMSLGPTAGETDSYLPGYQQPGTGAPIPDAGTDSNLSVDTGLPSFVPPGQSTPQQTETTDELVKSPTVSNATNGEGDSSALPTFNQSETEEDKPADDKTEKEGVIFGQPQVPNMGHVINSLPIFYGEGQEEEGLQLNRMENKLPYFKIPQFPAFGV